MTICFVATGAPYKKKGSKVRSKEMKQARTRGILMNALLLTFSLRDIFANASATSIRIALSAKQLPKGTWGSRDEVMAWRGWSDDPTGAGEG